MHQLDPLNPIYEVHRLHIRRLIALALISLVALGCAATAGAESSARPVPLRLGYFPNVTHATAIVGVENGIFDEALGGKADLETMTFNAGTDAVEALFNGAIDATYIGPNPAINAFARSEGKAIRIIAGATSGGAALVVRPGIDSAADLAGTTLASPSLGNTQDVALRAWLSEQGYATTPEGGGDVAITPQANGAILEAFIGGSLDGAWVPEPWATRMVEQGGGHVLVDERDLWPDGQFVTTHLIVNTTFLEAHPDVVKALLEGHVNATAYVNEKSADAQGTVAASIAALTDVELPSGTLERAWQNLTFTNDPIASSLAKSAADAQALGLLDPVDLDGIYAIEPLNNVLRATGAEPVSDQ